MFETGISEQTKQVLLNLSKVKMVLDNFYLAGGTGLALQIGHRVSVDLDFFSSKYPKLDKLVKTLSDNFEIKKLAAVLSRINLYITNDTGPMHIAGSTDTKMISLFGPTKSYEWAPSLENQFYIQSESGNINDITVSEVFELSNKIISGH